MADPPGPGVPVSDRIREQMRKESEDDRSIHRERALNRVRKNLTQAEEELKAQNVTPQELAAVIARIKQGSQTSHLDLRALKQALFDPQNSVTFLKTTGSLQALVGHLTGRKALHQLEAAYICCNLATGDEHSCVSVSNAAGPYLIEYLDGQNTSLQVACLWTLGNLAGGSAKSFSVLQAQGFLDRLINCMKSSHPDVVEASLYALSFVLRSSMQDDQNGLYREQKRELVSIAVAINFCKEDVAWLLYLLSCSPECDEILLCHSVPQNCINALAAMALDAPMEVADLSKLRYVTAMVRTAANLTSGESGRAALEILRHHAVPMVLNDLLHASHPHLCHEAEWLGMNLLHHPSPEVSMSAEKVKLDKVLCASSHDHVPVEILLASTE